MSATAEEKPKVYKRIQIQSTQMIGTDPEIFLEKEDNGEVVGAEKVLPKEGLYAPYGRENKVIIDGVQAELNPSPQTCRAHMGTAIRICLEKLETQLQGKGVRLSNKSTCRVKKAELESLSEENQQLGCQPSHNLYDSDAKVVVNQRNKYFRGAGGHIHITVHKENFDPKVMVPLLDLFVGNTCVLLDRDPTQAERRKQYGRAGEYRLPKYGIEYRTPSNFWLRSFPLMGMMMGLTRLCERLACYKSYENAQYYDNELGAYKTAKQEGQDEIALKWLNEHIDYAAVQEAINTNDYDLALKNFQVTKEFVKLFLPDQPRPDLDHIFPFWPKMIDAFEFFAEKGIDYWWPEKDIIKYWKKLDRTIQGHGENWEGWFWNTVMPEYRKHIKEAKKKENDTNQELQLSE